MHWNTKHEVIGKENLAQPFMAQPEMAGEKYAVRTWNDAINHLAIGVMRDAKWTLKNINLEANGKKILEVPT